MSVVEIRCSNHGRRAPAIAEGTMQDGIVTIDRPRSEPDLSNPGKGWKPTFRTHRHADDLPATLSVWCERCGEGEVSAGLLLGAFTIAAGRESKKWKLLVACGTA